MTFIPEVNEAVAEALRDVAELVRSGCAVPEAIDIAESGRLLITLDGMKGWTHALGLPEPTWKPATELIPYEIAEWPEGTFADLPFDLDATRSALV